MPRPTPRTAPPARLALICLLVAVAVLGAATATPWTLDAPRLPTAEISQAPVSQPATTGVPEAPPGEQPEPTDNRWIVLVLVTLLALLVAALITLAARKLLAIHREPVDTDPDHLAAGTTTDTLGDDIDLPELQDAVTRALAHLDGHPRPRDAVVAAWVALEEAAARAGTRRDPAQTPTEFTGTVLAATPAPAGAVTRLRTLYQRARFTDRPVDTTAVDQARTALAEIARSLDVDQPSPGGPAGTGPAGPAGPAGQGAR
ncbi:DUF4129 domain-containing protein [Promicromonospora sukumoe]|uniref:DUF4129 domain-containing protein n=1 Tax=Promicromonospora sukumoe TaxID=88382 RepID=UPI0003747C78|nr:DUF4129 domain-containing protein [Promicromonospora sukumoe]